MIEYDGAARSIGLKYFLTYLEVSQILKPFGITLNYEVARLLE